MIEVTKLEMLKDEINPYAFVYIYTPFCGTCQLARKMLETIEHIEVSPILFSMNASLFPDFMQEHKIESVPCLFVLKDGEPIEKIYAFKSVPHIFDKIMKYIK